MLSRFLPKTFTTLSGYTRRQFLADLQAGLVVGVVETPSPSRSRSRRTCLPKEE